MRLQPWFLMVAAVCINFRGSTKKGLDKSSPKGTHLLEKDAWKEKFLLQMKDEAIPVKVFKDDNDYRIWGFHFFNQDQRMKEFDLEFTDLLGAQERQQQRVVKYDRIVQENTDSYGSKVAEDTIEYGKKE